MRGPMGAHGRGDGDDQIKQGRTTRCRIQGSATTSCWPVSWWRRAPTNRLFTSSTGSTGSLSHRGACTALSRYGPCGRWLCRLPGIMQRPSANWQRRSHSPRPHGFVRVFADEGAPLAALLRRLLNAHLRTPTGSTSRQLRQQVARIQQAMKTSTLAEQQSVPVAGLVDELTKRELEVLQLIAEGPAQPRDRPKTSS
jgi:hypothetical protein